MAEFDMNQYELKGSFRIPRRSEAPAACKAGGGGGDSTGDKRSPLMVSSVASSKPITSRYGKKIVPAKRKQSAAPAKIQPVHATQPLDNILPAMMLPCTSQTAAKKKRHNSGGEADSGSMCSFPRGASECQSSSALTRDRLQRHSASANSMVFRMKAGNSYHVGDSFASKGLMEALLAQKIRTGRIESHTQIRETLSKQRRLGGVDDSAVSKRKSELEDEKKKGPRTPSGSPPPPAERRPPSPMEEGEAVSSEAISSSSSSSSNRGRSLASSSSTTTPAEGPSPYKRSKHTVKETAAMVEGDAAEEATTGPVLRSDTEILGQIAGVAGVNVDRLKQMMSPEVLTVLRGVDSSILLATVSTVLSTIAKSVNKANVSTSSSAAIDAKVEMNRKDDVTTTTNEVSSTSANPTAEERKEEKAEVVKERPIEEDTQCEMELDSNNEDGEDAVASASTVARPNFNFPPLPICTDRPPPPPPPQERQQVQVGDQRERDELAAAGQPNQVQIIRTLLNALDIPSVSGQTNQTSCHTTGASDARQMGPPKPSDFPMPPVHLPPPPPPSCLPAVEPSLVQPFTGLPPPLEKPPSPVLLDRYGMPLPTPIRRPRQNAPPPPFPAPLAPLVRGPRLLPHEMSGPPPRISIPPPPMGRPLPAVVVGAPISVPFGSHAFIRPPTSALASFLPPPALQQPPPLPRLMRPQLNMFGPPPVRPDFRSHRPKKQRFRP